MHIHRVLDRTQLDAYHSVEDASMAHDHLGLPCDPIEEWVPLLDTPETGGERVMLWLATDADRPVGTLCLRVPTLDNLNTANIRLYVHPSWRRRGYGRQLLKHGLVEVAKAGRTRVFAEVASPPDGSAPLGQRLLDSTSAKPVLEEVRRMLDLHAHPPGPRGRVPDGYRIVAWVDRCPDELVDGVAYLMGRMTTDAPMGEMDYEQEKWDAARYREKEVSAMSRQRVRIACAAVAESGQIAGVTEIGVNRMVTEVAYQWDTIVDPDHRGHGLGLVLKTWNHAALVEQIAGVHYLNTWNAASNTFMIAVNEALGFTPVETWTEWQLDL